jgi:hypothetical protein
MGQEFKKVKMVAHRASQCLRARASVAACVAPARPRLRVKSNKNKKWPTGATFRLTAVLLSARTLANLRRPKRPQNVRFSTFGSPPVSLAWTGILCWRSGMPSIQSAIGPLICDCLFLLRPHPFAFLCDFHSSLASPDRSALTVNQRRFQLAVCQRVSARA